MAAGIASPRASLEEPLGAHLLFQDGRPVKASMKDDQERGGAGGPIDAIPPAAQDQPAQSAMQPEETSPKRASLDIAPSIQAEDIQSSPEALYERENGVSEREIELEEALARLRQEKETLDGQYRSLVGKITTMRNTLGEKLKQDADELDRRAAEIAELRSANADLTYTTETLRAELVDCNADNQNLTTELSSLRSKVSESTSESEGALREAMDDLEKLRSEMETLDVKYDKERVLRERVEAKVHELTEELEGLENDYDQLKHDRDMHQTSANNLSSVLEEFQAVKEKEMTSATQELRDQLHHAQQILAEFKKRAFAAEENLATAAADSSRVASLEKEVKDKSLLVGKLRHEAVILNEHLTESLKRLRSNSSDHLVDRRLISNVLISFLCTPRADPKRFEMLQLMSTVLSWSDLEREKAGLQRQSSSKAGTPGSASRKKGHARAQPADEAGSQESETFSNLWVEYLLREATSQGGVSSSIVSTSSLGVSPLIGGSPSVNGMLSPLGSPPASPSLSSYSSASRFASWGRKTLSPTASSSSLPLSALSPPPGPQATASPSTSTGTRPMNKPRSDSSTTLGSTRRPSFSSTRNASTSTPASSAAASSNGKEGIYYSNAAG